jgi:tetratricopeptide (TPR) repeat protein
LAARAIELGQDDGKVLWMAVHATLRLVHDRQRAKELAYRSIELNPNSAIAVSVAGIVEAMSGNSDKALELLQRAQRLNPRDPRNWLIAASFALSHFVAGRYEEAIAFNSRALLRNPRYLASLRILTASLALLGQHEKAANALDRLLKMDPHASLSKLRVRLGHGRPCLEASRTRVEAGGLARVTTSTSQVRIWPKLDLLFMQHNVCFERQSRRHLLVVSFSAHDPEQTSGCRRCGRS